MTIVASGEHLDVRLIAHTHWDREWYLPAVRFRHRLVALIDALLEPEADSPFLLDGQAVVLEDYLSVRPERAADLSAALKDGRLEAGPWYVLADGLLPGGEALVRNLLAGRRTLRRLRAEAPPVLYCPDAFGHPAVLPVLAAGFGCPVAIVWRGYGGRRWPPGDTVRWRAADGSEVLLHHLPPDGYEFGSSLPCDAAAAERRWAAARPLLAARATTGLALWPDGADHHALSADHAQRAALLQRAAAPDRLVRSSLAEFASDLVRRSAGIALPEVMGELRDSYGYAWTLQGTFGVRAALKRHAAQVERLLVRDVEPWAALAFLRDGRWRDAELAAAWTPLLLCHPHDTICGCAIDDVALAMATRLEEAHASGVETRARALDVLLGHDPAGARDRSDAWHPHVVIRNRSARPRAGLAEVDVDVVLSDVPVGPHPAALPRAVVAPPIRLGGPVTAVQLLSRRRVHVREESPEHYPRNRLVERRRVLAWVEEVPASGCALAPLHQARQRSRGVAGAARAEGLELWNDQLRVGIENGHVRLTTSDGVVLDDLLGFEAEGERGDLYTHSAIPGTRRGARLTSARRSAAGPLRAELVTTWMVGVPERAVTLATGEVRHVRAARLRLGARIQLDAAAPFVRVFVYGDNHASDLRLRVALGTGIASPAVWADAAFGPVERAPLVVPDEDRVREVPPRTAPLHRYVSRFDGRGGCTVYADGLAEYEAAEDGRVLITLFRAVGELSRGDLAERPGHAGWPVETPLAQCRGPFEAAFAVMPHGPRTPEVVAGIERAADDVLLPLVGHTWRTAVAPPAAVTGIALEGEGLACSAIVESRDGEAVALRCVNLLDAPVRGAWRVPGIRTARLARLDETPLGALDVRDGAVAFDAPPRGVVTVLVR